MEPIKVLLCCGAGMSSGFLASSARKYAKQNKLPVSIEARSVSEAATFLPTVQILLLGPHYAVDLEKYKALATPYGVPVAVIPADVYASLDGERVVSLALTIKEKEGLP